MRCDTLGWLNRSSRAAAWKLPSRTMRSKARSWLNVTFMIGALYQWVPKNPTFQNDCGLLR